MSFFHRAQTPPAPPEPSGLDKLRDANDRLVADPGPGPRDCVVILYINDHEQLSSASLMHHRQAEHEATEWRRRGYPARVARLA